MMFRSQLYCSRFLPFEAVSFKVFVVTVCADIASL